MKKNLVDVEVLPLYLENESEPDSDQYVWAYCVVITNNGCEPLTLQKRFWSIIEDQGALRKISGEGVVGETPTILPQGTYSYTSGAVLGSPSGFMFGEYAMEGPTSGEVRVAIPPFSLDSPHIQRQDC